jgi:hypothetical protein
MLRRSSIGRVRIARRIASSTETADRSFRGRSSVYRVVRSTSVPTGLRPPPPRMRSPSQCPGTARSSASAGRSLSIIMPGIRPRRSTVPRGRRWALPDLRQRASSRCSSPRPWTLIRAAGTVLPIRDPRSGCGRGFLGGVGRLRGRRRAGRSACRGRWGGGSPLKVGWKGLRALTMCAGGVVSHFYESRHSRPHWLDCRDLGRACPKL